MMNLERYFINEQFSVQMYQKIESIETDALIHYIIQSKAWPDATQRERY